MRGRRSEEKWEIWELRKDDRAGKGEAGGRGGKDK